MLSHAVPASESRLLMAVVSCDCDRGCCASQEQVRDGFMEHTSQLQRFTVWLQLKDKPHSPTFQVLFKYVACNTISLKAHGS